MRIVHNCFQIQALTDKNLNTSKLNQELRIAQWKSIFNTILRLHNDPWIEIMTDKRKSKIKISIKGLKFWKMCLVWGSNLDYETDALPTALTRHL